MSERSHTKRLVLLDTHAIIHRAYHALVSAELTGPNGQPTGALYGLVTMLLKIITELRPDYIAACFDLAAPTIRHEAYEGYKGTRAKTDDALALQLDEAHTVFEAFSIPQYEREGFEADDLLGTIAHTITREKGVEVIIASGDMDTLQLVNGERVRVYTPKKGSDMILYDEKAVAERFGFKPILIQDLKGIMGDPSDNIKGVPGVGEGTALKLVQTYGTLDSIYTVLKKKGVEAVAKEVGVQKRYIQLVADHEEDARFSKSLATIRLDAPIAFTLAPASWLETVSAAKVLAMCDDFGFRSLHDRVRRTLAQGEHGEVVEEESTEPIDPQSLEEAKVMLWLISSEFTNPSLDDILAFTKEVTFDAARKKLETDLAKMGRVQEVYDSIEKPLIPIVRAMGERGVRIDTGVLAGLAEKYNAELATIEKRIYTAAGHEFNVSSPKQLGEVLFDELQIVPERQKKTAGGQRSTRESELEKIKDGHPIVADILEYRELKKLLGTYIENLPAMLDSESRLHAEFLQTGAVTGRMASQNPGLQNIPLHSERGRLIRHAFVASEGFTLVALDYSQIELRLAAILSGDEKLCMIFRGGRDVHREVASQVFHVAPEAVDLEMRRRAKVINFGILYGMGVNALRQQLGSPTAEAHQFLDEYFSTFKTLSEYLESTKGFARKHGYTETLFGRRRQFPEMKSSLPYVRAQAERMAINAPIQGTQADIIKLAMVRVDEALTAEKAREDAYLLLQVHDELVYEIRDARVADLSAKIQEIMESVLPESETRGVPILAVKKTGPDWGSMQA